MVYGQCCYNISFGWLCLNGSVVQSSTHTPEIECMSLNKAMTEIKNHGYIGKKQEAINRIGAKEIAATVAVAEAIMTATLPKWAQL